MKPRRRHLRSFYHVADAGAARDILKRGFLGDWGDVGFGVYFWDDLDWAREYAARGGWDESLDAPVIIRVRLPESALKAAILDAHPDWEDEREKYEHTYWHPMDQDREDDAWKPSGMSVVS